MTSSSKSFANGDKTAGIRRKIPDEHSAFRYLASVAGEREGRMRPMGEFRPSFVVAALALFLACAPPPHVTPTAPDLRADSFLDTLQERTFRFFWDSANPRNGLVPDRWPVQSFSSIAAVGFGLSAYPVGVERGDVPRGQARPPTLTPLPFPSYAPPLPQPAGEPRR